MNEDTFDFSCKIAQMMVFSSLSQIGIGYTAKTIRWITNTLAHSN